MLKFCIISNSHEYICWDNFNSESYSDVNNTFLVKIKTQTIFWDHDRDFFLKTKNFHAAWDGST